MFFYILFFCQLTLTFSLGFTNKNLPTTVHDTTGNRRKGREKETWAGVREADVFEPQVRFPPISFFF